MENLIDTGVFENEKLQILVPLSLIHMQGCQPAAYMRKLFSHLQYLERTIEDSLLFMGFHGDRVGRRGLP